MRWWSSAPGGGGNDLPRGGGSEHLVDQILRSYTIRLIGLWIGPTWYPSWYLVQPPITPNPPPSKKSLPYPIYNVGTDPNVPFRPMVKILMSILLIYFVSHFVMSYSNGEKIL